MLKKPVFNPLKYDGYRSGKAHKFSTFRDVKTAHMVEKNSEKWYNDSSMINWKGQQKYHDRTGRTA